MADSRHLPHVGIVTAIVTAIFTAHAAQALGQSGERQVMVFQQDDGGGPRFLQYTGPDMAELRTPDYVPRDLPVFNETLRLDDVQRLVMQTLLEVYLDAFMSLSDKLPSPAGPVMQLAAGGDGLHPADPGAVDAAVQEALRGTADISDLDLDVDGTGRVAIGIVAHTEDGEHLEPAGLDGEDFAVFVGTDEEGEEGAGPATGVFISLGGREDMELPEETRQKLEAIAKEMAEKLQAQLAEQVAAGGGPMLIGPDVHDAIAEQERRFEELREATQKFERDKEALRRQFVVEAQGQLQPEQLGRWPALERALVRSKTLPKGRLDGERTNLLEIAEALELEEIDDEAVAQELESYDFALHDALVARNEFLAGVHQRIDEAIQKGDKDKALTIVDKAATLRVAVRDVNERFTDSLAARLSTPEAEVLQRKALEVSYPRVYRPTRAQKAFKAARELPGLDPDVLAGIAAIAAAYETDLDMANERLRRTIRKHQPTEPRHMVEQMASMADAGGHIVLDQPDDPIRDAFKARRDLDERYLKQLDGFLTEEQRAAMSHR